MTSINTRTFSRLETILSFLLPVSFFLFPYISYGLNGIMFTYALICSVFFVIRYKHFPIFRPLSIYTILLVLLTCINSTLLGGQISKRLFFIIILYVFCGYSVSIIARHVDKDSLYKCWKYLGLLVGIVIAYQYIQITFLGQYVHAINVLPLTKEDILGCENWIEDHDRPVAFFTEPAAVVGFMAPLLALAQQKKDFISAIIVSITILFTASTSGLIVLIIMWSSFLFNIKYNFWTYVLFFLFISAVIYIFLETDLLQSSVDKVVFEMSGESSNMYTRVLLGWDLFINLDIRSMLMGIPDIDITNYALKHSTGWLSQAVLTGESELYTNTAHKVCLYTGLIGAAIYIWMLIQLYKKLEKGAKPYFWSVIALMFFASNFYVSGLFIMQFIILLSYIKTPDTPDRKMKKTFRRLSQ